jgi:hypothetical protein
MQLNQVWGLYVFCKAHHKNKMEMPSTLGLYPRHKKRKPRIILDWKTEGSYFLGLLKVKGL